MRLFALASDARERAKFRVLQEGDNTLEGGWDAQCLRGRLCYTPTQWLLLYSIADDDETGSPNVLILNRQEGDTSLL